MRNFLKWAAIFSLCIAGACNQQTVEKAQTDNEPYETDQPTSTQPVKIAAQGQSNAKSPKPNQSPPKVSNAKPSTAPLKPKTAPVAPPPTRSNTPFPVRRCMNLGNALEAENEGDWGYTIRSQDIATIKQAGFDTIRLPVRWDTHAAHRSPYTIDPAFMRRVKQVVDQAQANGLNIIVDVHHYENLMTNTARETPRFLGIWDQIATAFQNEPNSVIFEVLNEPTLSINMDELNRLYAQVVPIIRKTNPTRKLMMGGNSWNSVDTMAKVKWPDDVNLVATYHDYGPHEFTHQGASWMEPPMPMGRAWGGRDDQAEMRETFQLARAFKTNSRYPVFVGEFGVIDTVNAPERAAWIKARRKAMEAQGISWCAWDFAGAFSLYDLNNRVWKPGVLDALFGR